MFQNVIQFFFYFQDCGVKSAEINQFLNTPLHDVAILYASVFGHWAHELFVPDKCTYPGSKTAPTIRQIEFFSPEEKILHRASVLQLDRKLSGNALLAACFM